MENDKIFCGSGKTFGQYGAIGINICIDDIPAEFIFTGNNGKRYVKMNVRAKKNPDNYGNTHYVEVNTWKPNQNGNQNQQQTPSQSHTGQFSGGNNTIDLSGQQFGNNNANTGGFNSQFDGFGTNGSNEPF